MLWHGLGLPALRSGQVMPDFLLRKSMEDLWGKCPSASPPLPPFLAKATKGILRFHMLSQWLAIRSFRHGSEEWLTGWQNRHIALIISHLTTIKSLGRQVPPILD